MNRTPDATFKPCATPIRRADSARQTVVLLHSSSASSRQWDSLVDQLRPWFDVHAIDLHGHGRQAPWARRRPLTVHDEAALALPLIERAGGAHLIGHSYGGAVAVHLAASRPALVRSVAVYEPVLFGLLAEHEAHTPAAREAFDLAATLRAHVAHGDLDRAAQRFVDYWSCGPAWQQLAPRQQRSVATRMPIVVQHFDALYAESLPATRLTRLSMPLLCLSGDRTTAAAARIARLLRRLLPTACHQTLSELGHMAPITSPTRVNEHLVRHLARHEPAMQMAESVAA